MQGTPSPQTAGSSASADSSSKPGSGHAGGGEEVSGAPDLRTLPLQEQIASGARRLWESYGRPTGRDLDIWLEAERQLLGTDPEVSQVGGPSSADLLNQSAPPASTANPGGTEDRSRESRKGAKRGVSPSGASSGTRSNRVIRET